MKKYEITYIIHPDLEGSTAKITEKIKTSLAKSGGKILNEESWGKKKLAYEINKNSFGIYEFLLVQMEPSSVSDVERTLRLSEEVIRSMVVLAEDTSIEKKGEKKKAVQKIKKEHLKTLETKAEKKSSEKEAKETKKTKAEKEKETKDRQKELDEKLQAIIGPDGES